MHAMDNPVSDFYSHYIITGLVINIIMPFFLIFWYLFQIWNVLNEIIITFLKFLMNEKKKEQEKRFILFYRPFASQQQFLPNISSWPLYAGC